MKKLEKLSDCLLVLNENEISKLRGGQSTDRTVQIASSTTEKNGCTDTTTEEYYDDGSLRERCTTYTCPDN